MRKILFAVLASTALLAIVPTTALARHRHHRRHHHHAVRHETFGGSDVGQVGEQEQTAGAVSSFTNGVLTIMLTDGSTVSGRVTNATELECQAPEMATTESESRDGGSGSSGSDGGSGDNNAQQVETQGEDEQMCTTAALTPGTVVEEAELAVSSAGAVWDKVDLITG